MRKYDQFLVILRNHILEAITSKIIRLSPRYNVILIAEVFHVPFSYVVAILETKLFLEIKMCCIE